MAIQYRCSVNVLDMLKDAGYSTYKLRKGKLLGESVIQKLRNAELPSWNELNTICKLLHTQPGDLICYVEDSPSEAQEAPAEAAAQLAEE